MINSEYCGDFLESPNGHPFIGYRVDKNGDLISCYGNEEFTVVFKEDDIPPFRWETIGDICQE